MNRGRGVSTTKSGGFTIVETLIFLAVTMAMFVSAMILISGRQGKQQFNNALRDFESNLIDTANDVANGYYQSNGDIKCDDSGPGTSPSISSAGTQQGTNDKCIFIGRVVMPSGSALEQFDTYSLAGLRTNGVAGGAQEATNDVGSLDVAKPRLVGGNPLIPSAISTKDIGFGTSVQCIKIDTGGGLGGCIQAALAFLSDVKGGIAAYNQQKSGAGIHALLYAYQPASYDSSTLASTIAGVSASPTYYLISSIKSATVCLKSGTSKQYGLIKIGRDGSSNLTITSEIIGTACP